MAHWIQMSEKFKLKILHDKCCVGCVVRKTKIIISLRVGLKVKLKSLADLTWVIMQLGSVIILPPPGRTQSPLHQCKVWKWDFILVLEGRDTLQGYVTPNHHGSIVKSVILDADVAHSYTIIILISLTGSRQHKTCCGDSFTSDMCARCQAALYLIWISWTPACVAGFLNLTTLKLLSKCKSYS